ncbi:MAG: hypothetical protein IGS03_12685 [Candidatus Sericytochromatia bacterium]|nr:hypothetical protein [Candidatus Sericytochromatia bacterium]
MSETFDFKQLWQVALEMESENAQGLCQQAQQASTWPDRMQALRNGLAHSPADAALLQTLQAACTQPAALRTGLLQSELTGLETLVLALKALPKPSAEADGQLLQTWIDLLEAHFYASVPERAPGVQQTALAQLLQTPLPDAWPVSAADLPHWVREQPLEALQDLKLRCMQLLSEGGGTDALQQMLQYLNASLMLRQLT